MAKMMPDPSLGREKNFWDYLQPMAFPMSTQPSPQVDMGSPQGATQTDINQLSAQAGTGALPDVGGTLNVSGTNPEAPVLPPIANPYADPAYRQMQDQMYGKIQDSIAAQKLSEQDAQKLLKDYLGQEQSMDLSPLLAWVDSSYGTNLMKGYQKPMTKEERMLKAADLQDILRKAGSGVTEKELELLRAKMGDKRSEAEILANMQYRKDLLAAQKQKAEKKSEAEGLSFKDSEKMKTDWLKNDGSTIRGLARMRQAARTVEDRLNQLGDVDVYDPEIQKGFADLLVNYNTQIAQLGALTGPDLALLQQAITMPKNLAEQFIMSKLGKRSVSDIKKSMQLIKEKADFNVKSIGDYTNSVTRPVYDTMLKEYSGYSQIGAEKGGETSGANDPRVDAFMKKNNITDRNKAIEILRKAGKLQ